MGEAPEGRDDTVSQFSIFYWSLVIQVDKQR